MDDLSQKNLNFDRTCSENEYRLRQNFIRILLTERLRILCEFVHSGQTMKWTFKNHF